MTSRALPLLTLLLGCRAEDTQRFTSGLDSIDTGLGLTLTGMSGEAAASAGVPSIGASAAAS